MNKAIPEKFFYRIGEVCEITAIQPYVLRFWESEFPQLQPRKNRSGQRLYRREDIDLVLRIKELLYEDEYTIAGARRQLEQEARGGEEDADAASAAEEAPSSAATASDRAAAPDSGGAAEVGPSDEVSLRRRLQEVRSELESILSQLEREPGADEGA